MATSTLDFIRRRTSIADNIAQDLRDRIRSGDFPVGSRLIGRREMAAKYGVAQMAVQQAMNILMTEGIIRAENGRGTYVSRLPKDTAAPQSGSIRMSEPVRSKAQAQLTIGVIAPQWGDDPTFQDTDDDWPNAITRSFEWKISSSVTARLKYLDCYDRLMAGDVDAVSDLIDGEIDGVAIMAFDAAAIATATTVADRSRIPVVRVIIGEQPYGRQLFVYYDNSYAGYQAARHLIDSGYDSVASFCPFAPNWWIESRLRGIHEGASDSGCAFIETDFGPDPPKSDAGNQTETAYVFAKPFLKSIVPGCGIVAINDHVGYGILRAAEELGLVAGKDYGLVGFDDRSPSRKYDLTSLHPPLDAMGAEAAKLLLLHIDGDQATAEVRLRSHLVVRGSTQRKPSASPELS